MTTALFWLAAVLASYKVVSDVGHPVRHDPDFVPALTAAHNVARMVVGYTVLVVVFGALAVALS